MGGLPQPPLGSCSPEGPLPMTTVSTLTSVTASSTELLPRCVRAATRAWAAPWMTLLSGRAQGGLKDWNGRGMRAHVVALEAPAPPSS